MQMRCGSGKVRVKECWDCSSFEGVCYVYPTSYYDEKGIMKPGYYVRCAYGEGDYWIMVADAKGANKMISGQRDLRRFVTKNAQCLVDCPRADVEGWGEQYNQLTLWDWRDKCGSTTQAAR